MIRRLLIVLFGVLALSLGTVMTAAMVVPESNAGLAVVTMELACVVPSAVTLSPSTMNRVSAAHHTLIATLSFPDSLPPGAAISGVEMSLSGEAGTITATPGDGSTEFTFSREAVLTLVGPVNGDILFEVSGNAGTCTFDAQATVKINGPIQ